jgi:hypothetical protein
MTVGEEKESEINNVSTSHCFPQSVARVTPPFACSSLSDDSLAWSIDIVQGSYALSLLHAVLCLPRVL